MAFAPSVPGAGIRLLCVLACGLGAASPAASPGVTASQPRVAPTLASAPRGGTPPASATTEAMTEPRASNAPANPPFAVRVGESPAAVRGDGAFFHIDGALRPGAKVRVTGCDPDCEQPGSWLTLEEGGRILRRSVEVLSDDDTDALPEVPTPAPFSWARVLTPDAQVVAAPEAQDEVLRRPHQGATLALTEAPELEAAGWRARRDGGVVPAHEVEDLLPSPHQGVADPEGPLAFVLETSVLVRRAHASGPGALPAVTVIPAFGHAGLVGLPGEAQVELEGGTLPRDEVRLAVARPRPSAVPEGARWVHVDREENVLTAYEGDRWVYAALVSVGTPDTVKESDPGLFHVYAKHRHADMAWEGEYDVESVPDVLFYNRGEALHGAFWHDDFGHPVSYGCINLSLADARWLFEWAPPALPETWEVRNPAPGEDSLWVWVE